MAWGPDVGGARLGFSGAGRCKATVVTCACGWCVVLVCACVRGLFLMRGVRKDLSMGDDGDGDEAEA